MRQRTGKGLLVFAKDNIRPQKSDSSTDQLDVRRPYDRRPYDRTGSMNGVRKIAILLLGILLGVLLDIPAHAQERTSENDPRLKKWLEKRPQADTNKDGVLTQTETRAFQQKQQARQPKAPSPTYADVKYGPHRLQAFDIWLAESKQPSPVVLYIHGGGFKGGDKRGIHAALLNECLRAGYSFASINYRMIPEIQFPTPMLDSARAIQLIRHRADQWHLDANRIASTGGSAGGGISLWLAFHDDLAQPDSKDAISRESTRLTCVAVSGAQSSYDYRFTDSIGLVGFTRHPSITGIYGASTVEELKHPEIEQLMEEMSPIHHVTADDAPAMLVYSVGNVDVDEKTSVGVVVHHPRLGIVLKQKMDNVGISCIVQYPGAPNPKEDDRMSSFEFIKRHFEAK